MNIFKMEVKNSQLAKTGIVAYVVFSGVCLQLLLQHYISNAGIHSICASFCILSLYSYAYINGELSLKHIPDNPAKNIRITFHLLRAICSLSSTTKKGGD